MRRKASLPRLLRAFHALLWKDYMLDYRSPLGLTTQLLFSLSSGILAGIAYRSGVWPVEALLPVGVGIVLVFNSVFQAYATFLREREQGTLDAVRLVPAGAGLVYLEKTLYSYTWISLFTIVYALSYLFFTGWDAGVSLRDLILWILVVSLAMASLSSLASALLVYSTGYTTLAPMIVMILALPLLNALLPALAAVSQGLSPGPGWTSLALAFSLGLLLVGAALTSAALE